MESGVDVGVGEVRLVYPNSVARKISPRRLLWENQRPSTDSAVDNTESIVHEIAAVRKMGEVRWAYSSRMCLRRSGR